MPKAIPDGLTADHVLGALADLDSAIEHSFGSPTGYELVRDGKRYPPKAVVGLAFKHLTGSILGLEEFSGGEGPGQANYVLRQLGFEVTEKDSTIGPQPAHAGEFVTSRGFALPISEDEMAQQLWFNMWQRRLWPYQELQQGNTLYWYDTTEQSIVWKSRVTTVEKFEYQNKEAVRNRFQEIFDIANLADPYFAAATDHGYCVAFKVDQLHRLRVPKPDEYRFPQIGWLRCDDDEAQDWLSSLLDPKEASVSEQEDTSVKDVLPLALNQYRTSSSYKDEIGERYHFPNRYLSRFGTPPVPFVYYEPREGGKQVYFGTGIVRAVVADTEDDSHSYADLDTYQSFPTPLNYYERPDGGSWENAKTMRNSVRQISVALFNQLLAAAGINIPSAGIGRRDLYEARLENKWLKLQANHDPLSLRRKRQILEAFERPSWVTNHIKQNRGDTCSLCGQRGFVKRDGSRYCEIHHLFHLSKDPPAVCLGPDYLVVLCATCHRRMHYADVSEPERTIGGWSVVIDGKTVVFTTDFPTQINS